MHADRQKISSCCKELKTGNTEKFLTDVQKTQRNRNQIFSLKRARPLYRIESIPVWDGANALDYRDGCVVVKVDGCGVG